MPRRLLLAALIALTPSLALAQVNGPDFSVAAYVRNALAGNVVIGGNLTVNGTIIDTSGGITIGSPTGGSKGSGTINVAADYYKNGTIIPETVSLPLALSAGGNISCPTCVLISGTAHGDSAYAILSTDRYVYTNAAFTAARIWTLPAANSLAAGTTIWVQDAQGTVTTTNTLTVQRAGADTVNVTGTNIVMTGAGGGTQFTTDGVSNWGTAVQTVTTGGTGRQTLTNHGVIVGAATNPVTQLAVGSNGQLLLGATGADPAFGTMSQDCAITAAGVVTCTKTNNVAFGALATVTPGTGVATALGIAVNTSGGLVTSGAAVVTVKKQIFTSTGTYTPSTGMLYAKLECMGPGGGGGGAATSANATAAGGGGAGGYSTALVTAAQVGASKAVTIGTGGGGGAAGNNAGTAGSSATSVGTLCVANAGGGGGGSAPSAGTAGAGGTVGTGDIAAPGAPGPTGYNSTTLTLILGGPAGASSPWGAGGAGSVSTSAGGNCSGFGSGGGGAASLNSGGAQAGGAGCAGLVYITEYNSQ